MYGSSKCCGSFNYCGPFNYRGSFKWLLLLSLLLLNVACASNKAIITLPQSGKGTMGDALATSTVKPCRATGPDAGSCVLQVNDCPYGIARVKLVRKGSQLLVTPYCFIPAPVDLHTTGGSTHEDPGDL